MELSEAQKKIVKSKPGGCSLVRGKAATGKTTAAIHRILYLKNNYCLQEKDEILFVVWDENKRKSMTEAYEKAEQESEQAYLTLFSNERNKVRIKTIEEVIEEQYHEYIKRKKNVDSIMVDKEFEKEFFQNKLLEIQSKYKKIKILNQNYLNFIIEEIDWIKACNFQSLEEYQNAERWGRTCGEGEGPKRILKNSSARAAIYELMLAYNEQLKQMKKIDIYQRDNFAFLQSAKKKSKKYVHIIVEDAQNLSKVQLDLIQALVEEQPYSSMLLLLNPTAEQGSKGWLVKGRKRDTFGLRTKARMFNLSKEYANFVLDEKKIEMEEQQVKYSSMENFQYCDIRHHRKFDFSRDSDNISEIIVNYGEAEEQCTQEEVRQLPVYSDIAAGEPILIHSEQEANFYIPQYWLKGMKDCFILKVKGDSMIGADIEDGDFVVIRKQFTAQNMDIVAVELDGNATLKRLSLKKKAAFLMPENDKYSPISLQDREASILGVAVGVIKQIDN